MRRIAALAAGALAVAACGPAEAPPAPQAAAPVPPCDQLERRGSPAPRNLVLVVADTWRRDRIGAYGGPARTPHFDAFAAGALLFTRASSSAPWTKPAMATLFTGLQAVRHGVVSHPAIREDGGPVATDVLSSDFATLAEDLRAAGYQTAAFVANPWMVKGFGYAQGFDVWHDLFADFDVAGTHVVHAAQRWLRHESSRDPYFVYIHLMDAHGPYHPVPPEALAAGREAIVADSRPLDAPAAEFIARVARDPDGEPLVSLGLPANRALLELVYDQGVEALDDALGKLFDGLDGFSRRRGYEPPAVLVTSDHGEALFERGWGNHGHGLHDDEIGVPLAAHLPGIRAAGPVDCPVTLTDLRPTICAYLGLSCPGAQGVSLLPPARGEDARGARYLLAGGVMDRPEHRALRNGRFKLLYQPRGAVIGDGQPERPYQLFDLIEDPGETRDLLEVAPEDPVVVEVFAQLEAALQEALEAEPPSPPAGRAIVDDELRRRLEALGYGE